MACNVASLRVRLIIFQTLELRFIFSGRNSFLAHSYSQKLLWVWLAAWQGKTERERKTPPLNALEKRSKTELCVVKLFCW